MGNFSKELFVSRPEYQQILQWVLGNPSRGTPIFSLVSPPGTGKTWLMKAIEAHLNTNHNLLVQYLNAPSFLTGTGELDLNRLKSWLEQLYHNAIKRGLTLPDFNPNNHLSQSIEILLEILATSKLQLVVLLDGYDEIDLYARRQLDPWVISPLLTRACAAILMAYRTGCRIEDGRLRQKEEQLKLDQPDMAFGRQQFRRLYQAQASLAPALEWEEACLAWMSSVSGYAWDHPFINSFLFERGWQNQTWLTLQAHDFRDCLDAVIQGQSQAAQHPPLTLNEFSLLHQIALHLGPTWLMTDYEKQFGGPQGHFEIDPLLAKGVVENMPEARLRYRVAPGLYELLQQL